MSDLKKYTVAWICALPLELVAARLFLDERHGQPTEIPASDNNTYVLGRIHQHNVAIAALPGGEYGMSSAATVARDMLHTFPNIRISLLVGIASGAPTSRNDIRLGDVVVSAPRNGNGGIFQYEFGRMIQQQLFQSMGHLNQPSVTIRKAVTSLQADYDMEGHNIQETIEQKVLREPKLLRYKKPDPSKDLLFRSDFIHLPGTNDCESVCGIDPMHLVIRKARDEGDDDPTIHYGLIASANWVMRDAMMRDQLAAEAGVLCFETEAAGLMNFFPCLVVRGICDYADTHRNAIWQRYAAMTAAAYAADLLKHVRPKRVEAERRMTEHEGIESGVYIAASMPSLS